MVLKVIQINIYKGKYLDDLVKFLDAEAADIITLQEVTAGNVSFYEEQYNIFEILKEKLALDGFFASSQRFIESKDALFGNAVLGRFPVKSHKVLALKEFRPVSYHEFADQTFFPDLSRNLVDVVLDVEGHDVHAISCHGAWTVPPQDTPETLRQAKLIADYLKNLGDEPFIMGADMNMPPDTKIIGSIERAAANLMRDSGVERTTHPTVHKIAPLGYLIDYIFTSKHFKKLSLEVPNVLVSDHLPVAALLEANF